MAAVMFFFPGVVQPLWMLPCSCSTNSCHPRSTMLHRSSMCGLVAVAQLLASVAALDTFVVGSYGHMDSSCSPSDFLSRSQAVLVGFCFGRARNNPGRMYTVNDSHITDFFFQEPGCDGTVAKTEVFEIDACVQVPPGSPDSGVYYKFSVERGESTKGRQYSGANCTGAQW